jgi:hypothetical protein
MAGRLVVVMISFLAAVVGAGVSRAAELRPSPERPDVIEVGDPVMIGRVTLEHEMRLNVNLADFIEVYGRPDYAEVQEVQVQEPFAPYEVRIYYLRRNRFLAFGRVAVAPSVIDYGIRKYEGPIRPETLDRLLTAAVMPENEVVDVAPMAPPPPDPAPQVSAVEVKAAPVEIAAVERVEPVDGVDPVEEVEAAAATDSADGTDSPLEGVISRLEAAADRAALAATMAEQASLAATSSADRATASLEKITSEMAR